MHETRSITLKPLFCVIFGTCEVYSDAVNGDESDKFEVLASGPAHGPTVKRNHSQSQFRDLDQRARPSEMSETTNNG